MYQGLTPETYRATNFSLGAKGTKHSERDQYFTVRLWSHIKEAFGQVCP